MRPAVHASILRNRSGLPRPAMRPHTFSMRRLLLLVSVGTVIFVPGIVISIVGLKKSEMEMDNLVPGQRILYQAIGPALTTLGMLFLFCSCIYYYCYGTGESNRLPGGSHQKPSVQNSINSDNRHHRHEHLNTPDGAARRSSLTPDGQYKPRPSPRPSPVPGHRQSKEEHIPLSASDFNSKEKPHSSPPAIHVDQAPEVGDENEAGVRDVLVNGDVPSDHPSVV